MKYATANMKMVHQDKMESCVDLTNRLKEPVSVVKTNGARVHIILQQLFSDQVNYAKKVPEMK